MSAARNKRFEIDIEEIERQLRQSVAASPAPKPDPLAELARIVGQDDPFRGILGETREDGTRAHANPSHRAAPEPQPLDPVLNDEDRAVLHGGPAPEHHGRDDLFDPVAENYGGADSAYAEDDFRPLQARRSRGKLVAVMAALLVTTGVVAAGLYWRTSGDGQTAASAPPVITADKSPLKVAPEKPGGLDVPNQDRQIYDRGREEGQSRVVDGREQPLDVREATRGLPASGDSPTVSARAPVPSGEPGEAAASPGAAPGSAGSSLTSALGEPRRVRTVAVRPDGSLYTPQGAPTLSSPSPAAAPAAPDTAALPGAGAVPARPAEAPADAGGASASSPTPAQAEAPSQEPAAPPVTSNVLPPPRPRSEPRRSEAAGEGPTETASVGAVAEQPATDGQPKGNFVVQLGYRASAEEARAAYARLKQKHAAELDGVPPLFTEAEVGGKTVHRMRVGPLSKTDAAALCGKLKSSGGSCFVANL